MAKWTLAMGMVTMMTAFAAVAASAQEDVRKVKLSRPALKVIEEKCLVCHNRKRIDEAVKERMDMEKILLRMEKKGVALTEAERRVMGHFQYERPLKGKKGGAPSQERTGGEFSR